MKLLLIYAPMVREFGYKPIGISMLSAVLKRAGHDVRLFDNTFYDMGVRSMNESVAGVLNFKKVKFPPEVYEIKKTLKEDLLKLVDDYNPDLIGFSAMSTMYPTSKLLAGWIKEAYPDTPIIIGGKHATVTPEETIAYKDFDMICVGEGEEAVVELVNKIQSKEDITNIRNIWVKQNGQVFRNPVRPLIQDLDSLPYPDLSIWDKRQFLKPLNGKIHVGGDVEGSRGCPGECNYCANKFMHDLYGMKGFYRRKSPRRIVDEIKYLKEAYGITFLKFHDEDFFIRPLNEIQELANLYSKEVGIPCVIEINANNMTPEKVSAIKLMGCVSVSMGVENGNEEYRKKILNRFVPSNKQIILACKELRKAKIKSVGYNIMGTPYQTRENVFETIELNRQAKFDMAGIGFFQPYKGTHLREVCITEGYITGEEDQVANTREDSIMKLPTLSQEEMKGLIKTFNIYHKSPKWLYPVIRFCEKDKPFNNSILRVIREILYFKIFVLKIG
jgi:anaerobic magnesium-protoporphyrin IX monomethyl ester cyclase